MTGVPFFLLGRYGVPGAMSVENMKSALQKAMAEEQTAPAQGMTCGPDGCRLEDRR